MKILIIDTTSWSQNFANEMGKYITQTHRGGTPVNTPSYGNNGYGFVAPRTPEGYLDGKNHHIDYIKANELGSINRALAFYENTRADLSHYLNEKSRIEKQIEDLEARPNETFLPYNTKLSVLIDLNHTDDIIICEKRAKEYCENNNIELIGFRYEVEDEEKVNETTTVSDRIDLKVLVKAYKNRLIIETINPYEDDADYIGFGGGKIGCVLRNLNRLGVSEEAASIMSSIGKVSDVIGDLCGEKDEFSWVGNVNTILGPTIVGSRYYQKPQKYITIDNDIPDEVIAIINESEKTKEIDYNDIKFDLWLEFNENQDSNNYTASFRLLDKHYYDKKIEIINAPENMVTITGDGYTDIKASDEAFNDIADLFFHNILGENLIVRQKREPSEDEDELQKLIREFESRSGRRTSYRHNVNKDEMWDYVNSFFDLGFSNNIMNPSERYFRLSLTGTISNLKEKLSNFKLIKYEE